MKYWMNQLNAWWNCAQTFRRNKQLTYDETPCLSFSFFQAGCFVIVDAADTTAQTLAGYFPHKKCAGVTGQVQGNLYILVYYIDGLVRRDMLLRKLALALDNNNMLCYDITVVISLLVFCFCSKGQVYPLSSDSFRLHWRVYITCEYCKNHKPC